MFSRSVLEKARGSHEDIERYQTAAVDLLKEPPKMHRERVRQDHVVKGFLEHICSTASSLANIYDDKDGAMRDEIVLITGSGTNAFQAYYDQVRELREYHRSRALATAGEAPDDAARGLGAGPAPGEYEVNSSVAFSGPERGGKNLDLNELFVEYQNVDEANHSTIYTSYLQSLATMDPECVLGVAPPETIKQAVYEVDERNVRMLKYLARLRVYLVDFFSRAQPLYDIDGKLAELETEFERKWAAGELDLPVVSSAPDDADDGLGDVDIDIGIEPGAAAEVAAEDNNNNDNNGSDANGIKEEPKPVTCELCEKTFAKESVFECHCASKAHKAKERKLETLVRKWNAQRKDAVHLAYVVTELCVVLRPVIADTVDYISRKQARTTREIDEEAFMDGDIDSDEEMAEAEAAKNGDGDGAAGADGAGEQVRKTIDNYPVGWDGKPIPFWIYKLYGLDIEFKCEICGNTSYWGRRAFERHFQEWRHSHGMALLGIPNTPQFFEITKIDDAIKLWHKVCADKEKNEWKPEADEECEDADGNVYNKKMFDALVKQGIIAKPK